MRHAYFVYVLMFAAMAAGLWVIITLGAAMKAPDDLSGDWTVRWENGQAEAMRIEQSGRFFVVRFGQGPKVQMTLQPGWKGARDGRKLEMLLAGDVEKIKLAAEIPLSRDWRVPEMHVELIVPAQREGRASRNGMEATTRPAGVARAR